MLKGLDPVLSADLLWVLDAMGHGDDLALVDANHPAETIAAHTTTGKLIRLPGLTMERAARAILSVLPIDDFEPEPIRRMLVVDDPAVVPPVQKEVEAVVEAAGAAPTPLPGIERFAFYEAARKAFGVVQVGDALFHGFVVHKDGAVRGYVDRCPHTGLPLAQDPGAYLTPQADLIACAWHGALFRIADGLCIGGPCAGRGLTPWPVRVADGFIVTD